MEKAKVWTGPERRQPEALANHPIIKDIHARLNDGAQEMRSLREDMSANTELTLETKKIAEANQAASKTLIELFNDVAGAFRLLGRFGKLIRWIFKFIVLPLSVPAAWVYYKVSGHWPEWFTSMLRLLAESR